MYSRQVDDKTLTFGVSGGLIRNIMVMFDRETDTLWPQMTGEAIEGPLTGSQLSFVPAIHTTWDEWKTEFPETLALRKGYFGDQDRYASYYRSGRTGVIAETFEDDRLYEKEFVIGVQLEGTTAAYPYGVLNVEPVVNDMVGGVPLVVAFNAASGTGQVFDRRVGSQTLTFASAGDDRFVDDQTGSTWNLLTGEAVDGDLRGTQLVVIKSTRTFWFGWKDWFPDTRLYGVPDSAESR